MTASVSRCGRASAKSARATGWARKAGSGSPSSSKAAECDRSEKLVKGKGGVGGVAKCGQRVWAPPSGESTSP